MKGKCEDNQQVENSYPKDCSESNKKRRGRPIIEKVENNNKPIKKRRRSSVNESKVVKRKA